jgi:hypothetical protein
MYTLLILTPVHRRPLIYGSLRPNLGITSSSSNPFLLFFSKFCYFWFSYPHFRLTIYQGWSYRNTLKSNSRLVEVHIHPSSHNPLCSLPLTLTNRIRLQLKPSTLRQIHLRPLHPLYIKEHFRCINIQMRIHVDVYICMYIYVCTYTYIYIHIYTYTYTYFFLISPLPLHLIVHMFAPLLISEEQVRHLHACIYIHI